MDVRQETLRHTEQGFFRRSYSVSFDGQTGRIVRHASGTLEKMSEEKRAEIVPSAPEALTSQWADRVSGAAFCLNYLGNEEGGITFSELLKAIKATDTQLSVAREEYQGANCLRISLEGPYSQRKYWLDVEHGLAFRGREDATKRDGRTFVYLRAVVTEVTEAAPGVWCPREAYHQYSREDPNQPRENRMLLHISKVIANDPFFDEGVFRAPIPSGYIVTDKILGTRYRKAD
jgi:hypothetical protein